MPVDEAAIGVRDGPDGKSGCSDPQETQIRKEVQRADFASSRELFSNSDLEKFDSVRQRLTEAIEAEEQSQDSDSWKSPLWEFTRVVKSWYQDEVRAVDIFDEVDAEMQNHGGWERFALSYEEAEAEFHNAWQKIRYRADESPLTQAWEKAKAFPIKAPTKNGARKTPQYDRFVALAVHLQITVGDGAIMLPEEQVAELMDTTVRMVSLWRQRAKQEGVLVEVAAADWKRRRATEFRVPDEYVQKVKYHLGRFHIGSEWGS